MTDSATIPPTSAPATPSGNAKSPLDILDQILQDAQKKTEDTTQQKEAEEEQRIAAEKEQIRLRDQQKITEELAQLQTVTQMPQYQAAMEEKAEEAEEEEKKEESLNGMQIYQLKRTAV